MTNRKNIPFQRIIDRLPDNKKNIFKHICNASGIEYKYLQALYMGRLINPKLNNVVIITNILNSMFKEHKIEITEWVFPAETLQNTQSKIQKIINS